MKLLRKVRFSGYTKDFEVEFILSLGDEVLPTGFTVNLSKGYIAFRSELTREGDIYKGIYTYSEDSISNIEDDTLRIIEAVKKEIRKARENRNKAKSLTMEFNFEID